MKIIPVIDWCVGVIVMRKPRERCVQQLHKERAEKITFKREKREGE
jgi:hypothetical protein